MLTVWQNIILYIYITPVVVYEKTNVPFKCALNLIIEVLLTYRLHQRLLLK